MRHVGSLTGKKKIEQAVLLSVFVYAYKKNLTFMLGLTDLLSGTWIVETKVLLSLKRVT